MKEKEYFEDDRPIAIPEYIKKMSKEELNAEIERMEAEAREERDRIRGLKRSALA